MRGKAFRSSGAKLKRLQMQQAKRCAQNDHPILYSSGKDFFCVYCNALESDPERVAKERALAHMAKAQDEKEFGTTSGATSTPSPNSCSLDFSTAETSDKATETLFHATAPTATAMDLSASASHSRGVTIGWLVAWTTKHNCWSWSTSAVTKYIIQPATSHLRCRYTDLPEFQSPENINDPELLSYLSIGTYNGLGPSNSFVSHCWGAPFGDLVAALLDGNADPRRRVWIDVFAVRQWPGEQVILSVQ